MIYTFLTAAVFIIMIIVGGALVGFNIYRNYRKRPVGNSKVLSSVSLGLVAVGTLLLILIPGSFHTVEAGNVAVVKEMGVITDVEEPGTYFDFYLTRRYEVYDAKVQQVEIDMDAYTSDAQSMDISMTVQFQIRKDNVKEIAVNYGGLGALTNKIQSVAIERTKATLSQYQAEKLIEERNTISCATGTASGIF